MHGTSLCVGLLCIVTISTAGCGGAAQSEVDIGAQVASRRVTPDDPVNPKRIRFDVYGDPYEAAAHGSAEAGLLADERIRLGMRRYAAATLKELGYCPNGFTGPEVVLAPERSRLMRYFYVTCI